MKKYYLIGLMSGTSLDGLDICYVKFKFPEYQFQIIHSETIPYDKEWKFKLKNAITLPSQEILKLDVEYGFYLGTQVNSFITKYNIKNIEAIASHGHTVFHNPQNKYTLQIGHGAAIAKVTNNRVISDFRSQDVILGGQGAPLVPIGDKLLFHEYDACLNLGGFSNISFNKNGKRIAFDICPVNLILNYVAQKENKEFDEGGNMAMRGKNITSVFQKLSSLQYYLLSPPKSLGVEWCIENIYPIIDTIQESSEDILATFTYHIAQEITKVLESSGLKKVLLTGGGVKNKFLIDTIKNKTSAQIVIPDEKIIDYKEALIFAFLGMLKLENEINILSSVTGAYKDHSSGIIYTP